MSNLLERVVFWAKKCMESNHGTEQLMWSFHGIIPGKPEVVLFCPWNSNEDKRRIFNYLRMYSVLEGVTEYVVCSEAWMREAASKDDLAGDISKHPNRREALIFAHVKRVGAELVKEFQTYAIYRKGDGKLDRLEHVEQPYKELGGDLFNFIPPSAPSEVLQDQTRFLFELGKSNGYLPEFHAIKDTTTEAVTPGKVSHMLH